MELIQVEIVRDLHAGTTGAGEAEPLRCSSPIRPADVLVANRAQLRRVAAGLGLAGPDIDDCLQDVSVTALEKAKHFETRQDAMRWLIRVTVNRCLTEHRRRRSFLSKASEILRRRSKRTPASAAANAVAAEELELVRLGLKDLEASLRAPLVLRYFCNMDSSEIGRVLDIKPATVRSRLRDARLKLAGQLLKKGMER